MNAEPYVEMCVGAACTCPSVGDCACFCDVIAAYAQACSQKGVSINWRSNELCRECEEYPRGSLWQRSPTSFLHHKPLYLFHSYRAAYLKVVVVSTVLVSLHWASPVIVLLALQAYFFRNISHKRDVYRTTGSCTFFFQSKTFLSDCHEQYVQSCFFGCVIGTNQRNAAAKNENKTFSSP